jgi:NADH-quinone oxidoreductase subunit M
MSPGLAMAVIASGLPLVAALLGLRLDPTGAGWRLGLGTAVLVVLAGLLAGVLDPAANGAPLALDDGAALPVAVGAALAFVGLAACPRLVLDRATVASALGTLAGLTALFCARTPAAVVLLLPASLLPCWLVLVRDRGRSPLRTACGLLAAGTLAPLLVAGVLMLDGDGANAEFVALLALAALAVRLAVPPFHSWLPVFLEHAPLPASLLVASAPVVPWVAVRAVLPATPEGLSVAGPLFLMLGTAGALYGAIVGLVQTHLRRTLGWVLVSQSGAVMAAVAVATPDAVTGALVASLALGLSSAGLVVLAWAVEGRTGTASMPELGGLVDRAPRLGLAFLALGLAQVSIPGSLGFVAEDVMMHGIVGRHPVAGALLLVATALNAVTMFRAYQRAFLGPLPRDGHLHGVLDLVSRERAVVVVLALAIAGTGLLPSRLLALAHHVAGEALATRGLFVSSRHDP